MSTHVERVLKAVERLMKIDPSGSVGRSATRMHKRLTGQLAAVPMSQVMEKVPGTSLAAKARTLGVTRRTGTWRRSWKGLPAFPPTRSGAAPTPLRLARGIQRDRHNLPVRARARAMVC
jgi:hypothetical protein